MFRGGVVGRRVVGNANITAFGRAAQRLRPTSLALLIPSVFPTRAAAPVANFNQWVQEGLMMGLWCMSARRNDERECIRTGGFRRAASFYIIPPSDIAPTPHGVRGPNQSRPNSGRAGLGARLTQEHLLTFPFRHGATHSHCMVRLTPPGTTLWFADHRDGLCRLYEAVAVGLVCAQIHMHNALALACSSPDTLFSCRLVSFMSFSRPIMHPHRVPSA